MSHDDGIGKLWSEIGRRNVGRVALVYAGAAWGLVHMSTVMAEALEIPHWVNRFLVFLLVAFAPIVIGFSWVYELTPEGFRRAAEVEQNAALSGRTARRLDIAIIALMVVLAGLYIGERFLPGAEHLQEAAAGEGASAHEAQPVAAASGITVAVLPFLNLSSDKEQEFFSDGMTEEITSALAKVKGLRVVGRTSAFEFKGQNKDLRTIGKALSASHVLEGSVRKSGSRVRITGQLIKVDDGTHIWTEDYDRELTDVFAVQDDIARAIAGALQVPLGLQAGAMLVANRIADTDSYQDYLRAKAIVRGRGTAGNDVTEAVRLLEQVVARDPGYAPAWSMLSRAYSFVPQDTAAFRYGQGEELRRLGEAYLPKARAAARRAIVLNPTDADAYVTLSREDISKGWLEADDLGRQALRLDPDNPDVIHSYSIHLAGAGRVKEALPLRQRLRTIEPFVPVFNLVTGRILAEDGQYAAAAAILKALPSNIGRGPLGATYAAMGKYKEAADVILSAPEDQFPPRTGEAAVRLLRQAPAKGVARELPKLGGNLAFAYLYVGATEQFVDSFLAPLEEQGNAGYLGAFDQLWSPWAAAARKTERFKALMRKMGLVDYWRARGWPDVCHPTTGDDFECS
ncbi:MAG: hypothetical protein ACYCZX_07220 [Rhodospirillaceae bacterium]